MVVALVPACPADRAQGAPAAEPIRAAVAPSAGTVNLDATIWRELNAGWSTYGDIPVEIDWRALPTTGITPEGRVSRSGSGFSLPRSVLREETVRR